MNLEACPCSRERRDGDLSIRKCHAEWGYTYCRETWRYPNYLQCIAYLKEPKK